MFLGVGGQDGTRLLRVELILYLSPCVLLNLFCWYEWLVVFVPPHSFGYILV